MKDEDSVARDNKTYTGNSKEFSISVGGPLYRFYIRSGLLKLPIDLLSRRILAIVLITWLPLLLLTIVEGRALGGVAVAFLQHIAVHVRFLLSLPLLLAAEVIAHKRLKVTVTQFVDRNLIAPENMPQFNNAIASASYLRNSTIIELILLVISFTAGYWYWEQEAIKTVTWYNGAAGSGHFTKAGYWYIWVSLPIFRFIVFRWYFRLFLWYRFLWQVSRIPLRLNAIHPDRAGGLGFLKSTPLTLLAMPLAHMCYVSGKIADHIFHEGARLPQFKVEIAANILYLIILVTLPLTVFIFQLSKARRVGRREFGILATEYTNDFREKWIRVKKDGERTILGTADIQSLADLANSFNVVGEMRLLPFNMKLILRLGLLLAVPIMPLLLTMIPLEEIIDRALKMLL
jgi:hypothetical protein